MRKPARAIDISKTSSPFSDHQDEDFVEKMHCDTRIRHS